MGTILTTTTTPTTTPNTVFQTTAGGVSNLNDWSNMISSKKTFKVKNAFDVVFFPKAVNGVKPTPVLNHSAIIGELVKGSYLLNGDVELYLQNTSVMPVPNYVNFVVTTIPSNVVNYFLSLPTKTTSLGETTLSFNGLSTVDKFIYGHK